jgi:predicted DNA-binding transcriptional regulator AlpA
MARFRKRITKKSVMKMTGLDEDSLDRLIILGTFPAAQHTGKRPLWVTLDVLDWLIDNLISITRPHARTQSNTDA